MRRKIYRVVIAVTLIACSILVFVTWYAVGVIEKNNSKSILESRVTDICDILYRKEVQYNHISDSIIDDYRISARAVAMMLSKSSDIMKDELRLEEVRMAAGADTISVFDQNYQLEYIAGLSEPKNEIINKFTEAINDKLYAEVYVSRTDDVIKIIVGCARLDKSGVIVVEYNYANMEAVEDFSDISEILANVPIMETGCLAVIDNKSMEYIAHTDKEKVGKISVFDLNKNFFGKDDYFDYSIDGKDALVHFSFCNNRVVLGYIPYSEIYHVRNDTIKWVIASGIIISVAVTLTFRSFILHINKKDKKK